MQLERTPYDWVFGLMDIERQASLQALECGKPTTSEKPSMLPVSLSTMANYLAEGYFWKTGFILILGLRQYNVSLSQDMLSRV